MSDEMDEYVAQRKREGASYLQDEPERRRLRIIHRGARMTGGTSNSSPAVDTTPPSITSASSVSNPENSVLALTLVADETVSWSIIGGADQAQFELSGPVLRWVSNGTQDFETPADADTNNTYIVQVRATDLASNTADQTITVTVTDVTEAVGPTAGQPIGLLLALTKAA